MFEKAGAPTPDALLKAGKWNYAAFRSSAEAIKKATPTAYGSSLFRLDPQNWAGAILGVMYAHGGDLFSKDLSSCALDGPGSVAAWTVG